MTAMKKLGLALVLLATLGLGACGDDDGAGSEEGGGTSSGAGTSGGAGRAGSGSGARAGSTGSGTSSGSTADDIAMCMMMGTSNDSDCEGLDEYTSCVMNACEDEYKTCLGDDYLSGDFSGGMCESLADCTETAADPCTCDADAECINCFIENLVSCAMTCPLPSCTGGGGGAAGAGAISLDKTCDDLKDCCEAKSGSDKMVCDQTYMTIMGIGDIACSGAWSTMNCE
jgi:hypothetical protein